MSNSTDPIKVLASRFASLPPSVRLTIAQKLIEVKRSDQDLREDRKSDCSSPSILKKSLLEHFWDEVEKARGDNLSEVNPFTEERSLRVLEVEAVEVAAVP